jgi:phosphoribosylamine--glycine ligase
MRILVIGSGGREHALAWKIASSKLVSKLFCSPGNPGMREIAECVSLSSAEDILAFAHREAIGLVVIGPEAPLVEGLADKLRAIQVPVFGPSAVAAQLEGSKDFTKSLCSRYGIPTAAYQSFDALVPALDYARTQRFPLVIKADGLAAGKGVIIAQELAEAEVALRAMFGGKFGAAGDRVVIEEFLEGEEASFFALCDGKTAIPFGAAQDHKRVGDGDTGPNTGGMGTYSPTPVFTPAIEQEVMERIILPSVAGMEKDGAPFAGVLFAGLMLTKDGPKLIEYNVRFGDPETQVLMLRVDGDIVPYLLASARGELASLPPIGMKPETAVCVVLAANGYPEHYEKGSVIRGLENAVKLPGVRIFHAGTAQKGREIMASGGRVLNICAIGGDIREARDRAYAAVDTVEWPEGFCRRDIAWRAL